MECNKQEAIRAKVIAERKLLEKDFDGAKKVALKAQQLFPDLENISQLLSVCEVHCAAAIKTNGLEDWYQILQVEPTADELTIKKQYRKLALSLHPDKNKFPGAEAAFKLIGEAHRTLTDKEKRCSYDVRRKPFVKSITRKPQSQSANQNFYSTVQPGVPNFFQKYGPQQTISVRCPYCNMMHQLLCATLNRAFCCQNCSKTFVAYDPGTVPGFKHPGPGVPQHNWVPPQTAFKAANFSSTTGFSAQDASKTTWEKSFGTNFSSSTQAYPQGSFNASNFSATGLNGNINGGPAGSKEKGKESADKVKQEEQVNSFPKNQPEKFEEVKHAHVKREGPAVKSSKSQKASRKMKECSEDEFSDTESSDSDVVIQEAKTHASNMDSASNENRRRSTRQKRNVTYVESDEDDDDFVSAPKRSRVNTPYYDSNRSDGLSDANEISNGVKTNKDLNTEMNSDDSSKESSSGRQEESIEEEPTVGQSSMGNTSPVGSNPSTFTYPDPEFHDFDHDRDARMFMSGQIWATYDDLDGMPRFYAKIISIDVTCSFKVRFKWLEHDSDSGTHAETIWCDAGLPVACGNFKLGGTETTVSRDMFSHRMPLEKGKRRTPYIVKPGKGEVWALYENWNINWSTNPDDHQSFEYEIVEILSSDSHAVHISNLNKVKNFVSVFTRDLDAESCSIPSGEILRFSHMIPSYKIPVPEAESYCKVYYELDPAALPSDSEDKFPSVLLSMQVEDTLKQIKKKCFKPAAGRVDNPASHCTSDKPTPESEWLCNFELEKSCTKLAVGQIWALRSDTDGFPKYYAYICDVDDACPKVTVKWLDYCDVLENVNSWLSNALPIACGKFKFSTSKGSKETFCTLEKFSHLVQFESNNRHQYDIYPREGEVWALYRNWSIDWEESDLASCEYDVVEVLSVGPVTKAALLIKVNVSKNAIFMQKNEKGSVVTVDIPETEILRFSHCVPSHRLIGGPWVGCWQLDHLCVPHSVL